MVAHCAQVDQFAEYCSFMRHLYGAGCPLMTRDSWNAACREPRHARLLTHEEFDDNQEAITNGYPAIY